MVTPTPWIDRAIGYFAPRAGLRRARARAATTLLRRHYEAASTGRRTQHWNRSSGDINALNAPSIAALRNAARDLVRNNGYAESAIRTIADHAVGWGIVPKFSARATALEAWARWANSTACDVDGAHDFAGLQKLVIANVVESGEVLVRRHWRGLDRGLPVPMQLQVLEADFLDTLKTTRLAGGGRIISGVEYDASSRRVAYWLFPDHPGSSSLTSTLLPGSQRVSADEVLHIFRRVRPGQARGVTWFAPVLLRFKDFDEFEDAELMKQKIAACLAVITSDADGSATPLGTANDTDTTPGVDTLEPGAIINLAAGRTATVVDPPKVDSYEPYARITLRAIATGLGVAYEDLTGDYTDLPFSAARMSRLRHWARVEDWRWRILIPQLCDPAVQWWAQAARIAGVMDRDPGAPRWSAPPPPMIDPDKEGLAVQRNVRTGLQSMPAALRERGEDPDAFLEEAEEWNRKLDEAGILLDSDPRKMTQQGQAQSASAASPAPSARP